MPVSVGLFALACRWRPAAAPWVLLATSLLLCLLAGPVSLVFLAASILGNFVAAAVILRTPAGSSVRRWVLTTAIVANLLPLVFFKIGQQFLPLALPLGLAFYTLQQITFLIDTQKSGVERLGLLRFAAWGSFFGQLPAGPIGAYNRMVPQFARLGVRAPAATDIARGATLILAGVVKKTWLADPVGRKVDAILAVGVAGAINPVEAWTAAWGYLLQLYFDFSAYSDVAIGVGLCFGLLLPINFDSPLKAATPGQYVMRWHISMMTFVRDYIFEPAFRAARKLPIQPTSRRYGIAWALATLVAFLTVAAWHTASPWLLMQGAGVAVLLIGLQFIRQTARHPDRPPGPLVRTGRRVGGQILLLAVASVAALFLRMEAGAQTASVIPALVDGPALAAMFHEIVSSVRAGEGLSSLNGLYPAANLPAVRTSGLIAVATVIVLACPNTMQIFGIAGTSGKATRLGWQATPVWGVVTVVLLAMALVGLSQPAEQIGFIYARF